MEEQVGEFWHRLVTATGGQELPAGRSDATEVERTVSILFRALGGDGGLQVTSAEQLHDRSRRNWVQRLAGSQQKVALAWRDDSYLRLPAQLDCRRSASLNRDLYLWLPRSQCRRARPTRTGSSANQHRTLETLARFPVWRRYGCLVEAHIATRPAPESLRRAEAQAESAVRAALREPGSVQHLPSAKRPRHRYRCGFIRNRRGSCRRTRPPIPIISRQPVTNSGGNWNVCVVRPNGSRRRRATGPDHGSHGEHLHLGRVRQCRSRPEDEDDLDRAESIARDLDRLAVSRDAKRSGDPEV